MYLQAGELQLGHALTRVVWTNTVGVTASGNNLTKWDGNNWGNGGAASEQGIASGDGYVEWTASETTSHRMIGLSRGDTNQDYPDIDYGLYMVADGNVYVFEGGVNRASVGTYASGNIFRVAVEGGVVKYRKNGALLYTSTVAPAYPLIVDTSMYSTGGTLTNVVISGNLGNGSVGGGPVTLNYVLQDLQGSTRVAMNNNGTSSSIIARHDYLPFGEEIGSGTVVRTPSQGYGATDTNRQKYGLTERDDITDLDHTGFRKYDRLSGRWTSPDRYSGSAGIANPQSFNRYSYVQNDPVNFVDPTGLLMWCFSYDTYTQTATMATTTSHTVCFGTPEDFGLRLGGPGGDHGGGGPGGGRGGQPQNTRQQPTPPSKPPCTHGGSGQADVNISAGNYAGPTAGVIVTPDEVHPYAGITVGPSASPISGSIMGREGKDVDVGLNYNISFGSLLGAQVSGKLDLLHLRQSWKNRKWSSGATTGGISVSVVNVTQGFKIPCL